MSTMNVSLPDQMRDWVDSRIDAGRYNNVSEYVRELIRKDQDEVSNNQKFVAAIEAGRISGLDERPLKQIFKDAKQKAKSIK